MRSQLARLIVFVAAVHLLGGHWLALQSLAWLGMIANYARVGTFVVAIERAFDGAHPCELCKVVKKGQSEEQKQHFAKTVEKLDAVLASNTQLPLRPATDWRFLIVEERACTRTLVPLTPPPLRT